MATRTAALDQRGPRAAAAGAGSSAARGPAAVHLDLDGARHIFRLRGWTYDASRDPVFESGLRHALDVFDEAGITATLFVIAEDLEDAAQRSLLLEAVRRGHEIASHTVTHRRLATLASREKAREIGDSRERLEQTLGTPVDGFRAPDFSLDRESLELVARAGYAYDSSRIAGVSAARGSGLDTAAAGAHRPLPDEALLELPLPPHAPLPLPFHPSYSLVLGEWYFRAAFARAARAAGPFVLLFHLIDFSDPLPPALARGPARRLYTLSFRDGARKRAAARRMLARVAAAFAIAPTRRIVQALRGEADGQPEAGKR